MKKNPGRKERRRIARQNKRQEGRRRAKLNEWLQHNPDYKVVKKEDKK